MQRYDRLDDTALTNVDNSKRLPGESHDQQWLVLIWVTWSQGPQKWAAVTFPLGTRAVWGGTADAAVCAVQPFFIYLLPKKINKNKICAASSAFTAFSATSSLTSSCHDLSEPLEASGPEEPPVSARLQFGQFSIRRSPLKTNICFSHITYFMNGAAMHHWTLTYCIYNPTLRESNLYGCVSALNTLHIICLVYPSKYSACVCTCHVHARERTHIYFLTHTHRVRRKDDKKTAFLNLCHFHLA